MIRNPRILLYVALGLAVLRLGARAEAASDTDTPRLQFCAPVQPDNREPLDIGGSDDGYVS